MTKPKRPAVKKCRVDAKGALTGSYSVGFGKPPLETRFKPGQSGNPHGRKKGSENFTTLVKRVFGRKVTVQIHGSSQRITMSEAVLSKIMTTGLNGDVSALRLSVNLMQSADADAPVSATLFESESDRQLLRDAFNQVTGVLQLAQDAEENGDV